ncbi:MAG: hypothetical protein HY049_01180 [Acidobacteria bacterium]|nr:hypothetical protein [Acidobacteriota bacterium]
MCPNGRAVIGFDAAGDLVCTQGGCPAGQMSCGGLCVDSHTDPANCGACDNACAIGETCKTGTCQPFPSVVDNSARLVIDTFDDTVLVTMGPSLDIERISGFDGFGRPLDSSGPNMEGDFVFEYSGPQANTLQGVHDNFVNQGLRVDFSLIVRDIALNEIFRWNFRDFGLATIEPAAGGGKRYVMHQTHLPDNRVQIEEGPPANRTASSNNLLTDTRVEIAGIQTGPYPVVVDDPVNRTLTLTYDFVEGGGVLDWVREIATLGTSGAGRRAMSVIRESSPGVEIGRTNYFECFPIRYENFTGFGQPEKIKERVVVAYGFQEPG